VRKCPFCEKDLNPCDSNHIYYCGVKNGFSDKRFIKYKFIHFNFSKISDFNFLKEEYETNLKSLPVLKKEYGIDFKSILFLLDYFNIRKRNISESSIKISKGKFLKTMMKRYNTDNPSRVDEFKRKREQTCVDRFGVNNIRKVKNYMDIVEKTIKEKYGVTYSELQSNLSKKVWSNLTDENKNLWLKNSIHSDKAYKNNIKGYNISKLETRIQEILNEMGISYTTQFCLKNEKMRRFYDFLLIDIKLIIEVNGDYWHANPKLYKENDILNYKKFGTRTAKDMWIKDEFKKDFAEKKGYIVMYIWESEINENKYNLTNFVINKIKNFEI